MKHACEKMSALTSARLDRQLNILESLQLYVHLLMCAACRQYDAQLLKLHTVLQHRQQLVRLPEKKRQHIKQALHDMKKNT